MNCNMNENVKVHMKAIINTREANDLVYDVAVKVLEGSPVPEEFEDLFTFDIITRPSGSRYIAVDFA